MCKYIPTNVNTRVGTQNILHWFDKTIGLFIFLCNGKLKKININTYTSTI